MTSKKLSLRELRMARNKLGNGCAASLATLLREAEHLAKLDISDVDITSAGASSIAGGVAASHCLREVRARAT